MRKKSPQTSNRISHNGRSAMCNVLVIDDEQLVSQMLQELLTLSGFNVETASGGHEGVQLFEKGLFDLVITDILMPGLDGHDVARHIRNSDRPHTPIIAISGTPWLLNEDEFDSAIPKPFEIKTLLNTIHELT
jgi:CheY-like chemotaxis protein